MKTCSPLIRITYFQQPSNNSLVCFGQDGESLCVAQEDARWHNHRTHLHRVIGYSQRNPRLLDTIHTPCRRAAVVYQTAPARCAERGYRHQATGYTCRDAVPNCTCYGYADYGIVPAAVQPTRCYCPLRVRYHTVALLSLSFK